MRFHVLGLSHTPTLREFSADAFCQKVRLLCKMAMNAGHTVFHYGVEGSSPICTEHVDTVCKATHQRVHGGRDWKKDQFLISLDNDAAVEWTKNTIDEIRKRQGPGDVICVTFGLAGDGVVDAFPNLINVETGIGYEYTLKGKAWRVFESYAWMHYIYGTENKVMSPTFYDAVIPNYYDLSDYTPRYQKDNYFFWIGRPSPYKGLEIAKSCADAAGVKLYVAGQGDGSNVPSGCEFLGVLSIEERNKWMAGARAVIAPTYYIEPFCGVSVEAMLCGTPVITTDFGAFTENILHGEVGFRCRTMEQFHWAAKNIGEIDPKRCREYAEKNFSLERVWEKYEEYFKTLSVLYNGGGWYSANDDRTELNWLRKY